MSGISLLIIYIYYLICHTQYGVYTVRQKCIKLDIDFFSDQRIYDKIFKIISLFFLESKLSPQMVEIVINNFTISDKLLKPIGNV